MYGARFFLFSKSCQSVVFFNFVSLVLALDLKDTIGILIQLEKAFTSLSNVVGVSRKRRLLKSERSAEKNLNKKLNWDDG